MASTKRTAKKLTLVEVPKKTKSIMKAKEKSVTKKALISKRISKVAKKGLTGTSSGLHHQVSSICGVVVTFGCGDVGQLGLGSDVLDKSKPGLVSGIDSALCNVVAGGMHSLCVTKEGQLYSWGCNDEGALGHLTKEEEECFVPKPISIDQKIVQVSAGDSHTAALTDNGLVYFWGLFRDSSGTMTSIVPTPTLILPNTFCSMIASGSNHLVCVAVDGNVFTCGTAEQGQLGRVSPYFTSRGGRRGLDHLLTPGKVHVKPSKHSSGPVLFDACWAGAYCTFIRERGSQSIYVFGLNNYRQLGVESGDTILFPVKSSSLSEHQWSKIAGGQHHTVCLSSQGQVFSLGRKEYGRLGLGKDCDDQSQPTLIPTLQSVTCCDVGCGESVSFAVAQDGTLYSWGMGTNNQLGTGEDDNLVPTKVTSKVLESHKALRIDAGGQHTIALVSESGSSSAR